MTDKNLTLNLTGEHNSGKTRIALLIRQELQKYGIVVTVDDQDVLPDLSEETLKEHIENIVLKHKVKLAINVSNQKIQPFNYTKQQKDNSVSIDQIPPNLGFNKSKEMTPDEIKYFVKQHASLSRIPKRKQFKHLSKEDFDKLQELVKKDHDLFWNEYRKKAYREIEIALDHPYADLLWGIARNYTKNWKSISEFHSNLRILSKLMK